MRRILAVLAAATLLATSADAIVTRHDVDDAAYLGNEADYPALASLFTTREGHRDCVATLIDPEWMITAKHCTTGGSIDQQIAEGAFSVMLAEGREVPVSAIVRMPDADGPPLNNDVALLRLRIPVTDITPIPLYDGSDAVGRVVLFPGWGGTGTGITGVAEEDGFFRVAQNRVESTFANFLVFRFDDPRAQPDHALPCEGISGPGDSGGPALLATPQGHRVAGISSWQRTYGGEAGLYGVDEYYVRISAVREWIDSVIVPS